MLEPLHLVAEELIEREKRGKAHSIEYTDYDVVASTVVFLQILASRKAHSYFKEATESAELTDLDKVKTEMEEYGKRINQLVRDMTGIDLNEKKGRNENGKQ